MSKTKASWRVDETHTEVKGEWQALERAVASAGNTLDFRLRAKRAGNAAARFFRQVLKAQHTQTPRVITVAQKAASPVAIDQLKVEETIAEETALRQLKALNNIIEQEHRTMKRLVKPMMGGQVHSSAREAR